jgi:uncharacterized protein (TIGR04222 family)
MEPDTMNQSQKSLYQRIEEYSLDDAKASFTFSDRLARENGWDQEYVQRVVDEYKKFMFLALSSGHPVTPSDQIDQVWHLHLLYTQSYWEDFCGEVLGKRVHHGPTKGGTQEKTKYHNWYERTKESYRLLFKEEPPCDIWPDSQTRFGEDIHFSRVNTKRNWIIPKSPLKWLLNCTVFLISTLIVVSGSASKVYGDTAISVTPMAMSFGGYLPSISGKEFLAIFVLANAISFSIAAWIRSIMKRPVDENTTREVKLDPYDVAYLSGGKERAVKSAIASMVSRDILNIEKQEDERVLKVGEAFPDHPIEKTIFEEVEKNGTVTICEIHEEIPPFDSIEEKLKSENLIVSQSQDVMGRLFPVLITMIVPLLSIHRIAYGLSQEKPTGLLIFGCIVGLILTFVFFGQRLFRTWKGDRILNQMKQDNSELSNLANQDKLTGMNLALAVGLFGADIIKDSHEELFTALTQANNSDYNGGCGGGCGGCGCGGCGCGGCG